MRLIRSSAGLCMMLLAFSVHTETMAAPFVPGSPCNGCTVEIFDHTGVLRTAKNAVFRVSNPQTPNGPAPFLELYNPTLAMIEDCAAKVDSIRKPAPGSVVMNAREYQLSGSNQVVFLIEDCEGGGGPGSGEGGPIDEQDDPSLGPIDDGSGLGCAGSGDVHWTPGMCADLGSNPASVSGPAWQTVTNTLSEPHCNLGYTDSAIGPDSQLVPYDNTYTVMCDEGNHRPEVYVGTTRGDSNWGAYVMRTETCKMKVVPRPSDGARVVEVIVCPAPDDGGPPDDGSGRGCAGSGDVPASTSCSVSGGGWQTVTHTLSEANCNLGHTDSVSGSGQLVLYDNTYTVMCDEGNYTPDVYVGETAADSNWGAYTTHNETCKMKTGPRPSDGTRVIETIVCPAPDDGHRDDGDGRPDDRGDGRHDDRGQGPMDCPECGEVGACFEKGGSPERCCSIFPDDERRKECMRRSDGRHDDRGDDGRQDDRGDEGRQDDRGDEGQYDPTGEPSNYARMYGCGPMVDGRAYSPTYFSSPDLPDYQADGTCNGNHPQDGTANRTCKLKIAHFDSTNSPTLQSGQGASTYTMYGVELVGQPSTVQQPLTLRLNYAFTDVSGAQGGIADSLSNYSPDSVVDCLGALDDATTPREGWILVEDDGFGELRILHTPMLFLEF